MLFMDFSLWKSQFSIIWTILGRLSIEIVHDPLLILSKINKGSCTISIDSYKSRFQEILINLQKIFLRSHEDFKRTLNEIFLTSRRRYELRIFGVDSKKIFRSLRKILMWDLMRFVSWGIISYVCSFTLQKRQSALIQER